MSITVALVTASAIPDLVVANEGSNDVSVLIGSLDAKTGLWTETPYQRQSSGGSGPIAVAVEKSSGTNGPSLLVSNSDGTVALLPGIGSGGVGSGFFAQPATQPPKLDVPIVQSLFDTTSGQLFVVGADGSVSVLTGDAFTPLPVQGVVTLGAVGAFLAAGFEDGGVGLLESNGTELASVSSGFADEPSALEVLKNGGALDVFLTEKGNDVPLIVSFALNPEAPEAPVIVSSPFIPIITEVHATAPVAQGSSVAGNELVLVAVLVSGGLVDAPATATGVVAPGEEVLRAVHLPRAARTSGGRGRQCRRRRSQRSRRGRALPVEGAEAPAWEAYPLGAAEALRKRLRAPADRCRHRATVGGPQGRRQSLQRLLRDADCVSRPPGRGQDVGTSRDGIAPRRGSFHGGLCGSIAGATGGRSSGGPGCGSFRPNGVAGGNHGSSLLVRGRRLSG